MNHEKIEDAMGDISDRADNVVARVATAVIGFAVHALAYGWVPILTLCTVRLMSLGKPDAVRDHMILYAIAFLLVMLWIDVKKTGKR